MLQTHTPSVEHAAVVAGRASIERLQAALLKMPPLVMEKKHHFAKGLYARELHIPKGCCLVGRIHLQEQINFILKGDITVFTEGGKKRYKAGDTVVSGAGAKRAGFAHEDTIWTTVLATDLTDPDEIYEKLTAMGFDEFEALVNQKSIAGGEHGV